MIIATYHFILQWFLLLLSMTLAIPISLTKLIEINDNIIHVQLLLDVYSTGMVTIYIPSDKKTPPQVSILIAAV